MTYSTNQDSASSSECAAFERQLADYLDGSLALAARPPMDEHRRHCAACHAIAHDLEALVQQATALPVLTPSRDLWTGIESRLGAAVIPLASRGPSPASFAAPAARRMMTVRTFAIAAALLVAVTSGVTWRLARVQPGARRAPDLALSTGAVVPSANALLGADSVAPVLTVDGGTGAQLVAASQADVDGIYEHEIVALRQAVNERFAELDSTTVLALQRNLAIIDAAIADSRRALQRDPRSRLLSTQLDRALESKLALMRRVALL